MIALGRGAPLEAHSKRPPLLPALCALSIGGLAPIYRTVPPDIRTAWLLVVAACAVASVGLLPKAEPYLGRLWRVAALLLVVATMLLMVYPGDRADLNAGIQILAGLCLGPFAVSRAHARWPSLVVWGGASMVAVQSASAVVAWAQVFMGSTVAGGLTNQGRAAGLSSHPNVLGIFSAVAVLALVGYRGASSKLWWIARLGLVLINIGAILVSGSLSALSSLVVGLTILVLASERLGRWRWPIIFGLVLAAALIADVTSGSGTFADPVSRYHQVVGDTSDMGSLQGRTETYAIAWQGISHSPIFGVGFANGGTIGGVTLTHNMFLRAWYQGGILMASGVVLVLAAGAALVVRSLLRRQAALEAAVVGAMLLFSLSSTMLDQLYYWIPVLGAWAALGSGLHNSSPTSRASAEIQVGDSPIVLAKGIR